MLADYVPRPPGVYLSRSDIGRWHMTETKDFDNRSATLGCSVPDAIRRALGPEGARGSEVEEQDPCRWTMNTRIPRNLYEMCQISVTLTEDADLRLLTVSCELSFESTPSTPFWALWMEMSIIGFPFVQAWRKSSIERCEALARSVCDRLWASIAEPMSPSPYR